MSIPAEPFLFRDQYIITRKPTPQDVTMTVDGVAHSIPYNTLFHLKDGSEDHIYVFRGVSSDEGIWRRMLDDREVGGIIASGNVATASTNATGNGQLSTIMFSNSSDATMWNNNASTTLNAGYYKIFLRMATSFTTTATPEIVGNIVLNMHAVSVGANVASVIVLKRDVWGGFPPSSGRVVITDISSLVNISASSDIYFSVVIDGLPADSLTITTDTNVYIERTHL